MQRQALRVKEKSGIVHIVYDLSVNRAAGWTRCRSVFALYDGATPSALRVHRTKLSPNCLWCFAWPLST